MRERYNLLGVALGRPLTWVRAASGAAFDRPLGVRVPLGILLWVAPERNRSRTAEAKDRVLRVHIPKAKTQKQEPLAIAVHWFGHLLHEARRHGPTSPLCNRGAGGGGVLDCKRAALELLIRLESAVASRAGIHACGRRGRDP